MPTSTILSVVILVIALISVVSFAAVAQNIRHAYLQQMAQKIIGSYEVVSVSAWRGTTDVVLSVKNIGSVGVNIRTLDVVVGYLVRYSVGNKVSSTVLSYTKRYSNIYLAPGQAKYLFFDLRRENIQLPTPPQQVLNITITDLKASLSTDNNVFVYNPVQPMDAIVIPLSQDSIGKGYQVVLPNGKIAQLRVYEYMFCSVGFGSRLTDYPSRLAQTTLLMVAYDKNTKAQGFYQYAYDYKTRAFADISISANTDNNSITTCSVSANGYSLDGYDLTISRGLIILGTQLSGYDIVSVLFAETPYPEYAGSSGNGVSVSSVTSTAFVTKIPLPDKDIDVMDFLGTQTTSVVYPGGANNSFVLSIGNYYSQAILVGQAINLRLSGSGDSIDANAKFYNPYPLYIVIAVPTISTSTS